MEFTHGNVRKWFDEYFADFNRCNGNPKTVPNMENYFSWEFNFIFKKLF
jgi:hypothetical protein